MASFLETDTGYALSLSTPLGANVFIVDKAHVIERLSDLFTITLDTHSPQNDIDFSSLMGKPAQLKFTYGDDTTRYFSGVIAQIRQGLTDDIMGHTRYTLTLRPTFWMALHNQDYKIYQNKSAQDIIKEALPENNVSMFKIGATDKGSIQRKYCVRYGESAHHFLTRLMTEEGIFYFFKHSDGGDSLQMLDDVSSLEDITPGSLRFLRSEVDVPFGETVFDFFPEQQVVPSQSALADYDFVSPSTKLYQQTSGKGEGGAVYRYPGRFFKMNTGEGLNKVQIEELEWARNLSYGKSTAPTMLPGGKFTLTDYPRDDANAKYTIYEVEHFLDLSGESKQIYENRFACFPGTTPFRPEPIAKPRIYSNQVAVVTGPAGEEIHTDEHGRIKVQFFWDQYGKSDDTSSCWIRVAQLWSGKGWGSFFLPRVGMEVVVSFLEGDPDRPMVVGCVYNGENKPPYPLPDEKTKSTLKTNSSKDASDQFNEIRFEDSKDKEEIYMRAQKDWNRESMKGNRTLTIHEGNDTKTITKGNYTLTHSAAGDNPPTHTLHMVKGDQITTLDQGNKNTTLTKGNCTFTITEGNLTNTLTKGNESNTLSEGNLSFTLTKGDETHSLSEGNLTFKLDKGDVTIEAPDHTVTIKAKTIMVQATDGINIAADNALNLSGQQVTITTKSTVVMTKDGGPITFTPGSSAMMDMGPQGTVKAAASITVDGGAAAAIKGASISIG